MQVHEAGDFLGSIFLGGLGLLALYAYYKLQKQPASNLEDTEWAEFEARYGEAEHKNGSPDVSYDPLVEIEDVCCPPVNQKKE